jgi:hypothetical protein
MAPAVQQATEEYWRPANRQAERVIKPLTTPSLCATCETEYPTGARFCYVCGQERDPKIASREPFSPIQLLDMEVIRQRLRLSVGSLVFFLLALACMAGALLTGFVYRPSTVLDWQAVQTWRIEWLLAATAAMLGGILLKKKDA